MDISPYIECFHNHVFAIAFVENVSIIEERRIHNLDARMTFYNLLPHTIDNERIAFAYKHELPSLKVIPGKTVLARKLVRPANGDAALPSSKNEYAMMVHESMRSNGSHNAINIPAKVVDDVSQRSFIV